MTNEEAIKWLVTIKKNLGNPRHECRGYYAQAIDEICELLKEHEPVKPKFVDGKHNHFVMCGNCNTDLIRGMKYCSYCGRKVQWDG